MASKEYHKYIKSHVWRLKKKTFIKSFGKICYCCGKKKKSLHLHHLHYLSFGNEKLEDLRLVCKMCHQKIHKNPGYIFEKTEKLRLKQLNLPYIDYESNFYYSMREERGF